MKIYRITRDESDPEPSYVGTFAECSPVMKGWNLHETSRAELIDFPVDKENLLAFLNGESSKIVVEKTWALTPRGGLKVVPNGE